MAQTGGEGEREEDIMTLGRETQAGVGRVSGTGVMRVLCVERAAVSMKRDKAAGYSRRLGENGSCNNLVKWIYNATLV
ncbi:MAG: hypothetical protein HP493_02155 [Nitrospira sp.]|nr:hypothetical protein [Nitrospira sp.]